MTVYKRLGVKRVINACGPFTSLGGSVIARDVLDAMDEAAESFVDMNELHEKAGEVVAKFTGAEAGLVTSGSTAGLILAAAACMTGIDPVKIQRLPDTQGMKSEILIQKGHSVTYAQQIRFSGARIVEVGTVDQCSAPMLEEAVNEKTAAIIYVVSHLCSHKGILSLKEVVEIGKMKGVPVIVDAADQLPPASNLKSFIEAGADLVVMSGGKGLQGPGATGIIYGRRELITACRMHSSPNMGVGRSMKVSKEQIVGLVAALELYVKKNHDAELRNWEETVKYLMDMLKDLPHITLSRVFPGDETGQNVPRLHIALHEESLGLTAWHVVEALRKSDPAIEIRSGHLKWFSNEGILVIDPSTLRDGEERIVAERLRKILLRQA